ncbi:hypothetical protein [Solitalea koreensis]|nr:hypothetical protein [Solitalea koreensis]
MKKLLLYFAIATSISFLVSGCAASYKHIHPSSLNYSNKSSDKGVDFYYSYNVLQQAGNKKYGKKEEKNFLRVVSVKLTNNSGKDLSFGDDIRVFNGDTPITINYPAETHLKTKQTVPTYFLYMLFSFVKLNITKTDQYGFTTGQSYPIGLVLGPGLTLINVLTADGANKKYKDELISNNPIGKIIKNGETVYGLMSVNDTNYNNLQVKVIVKTEQAEKTLK